MNKPFVKNFKQLTKKPPAPIQKDSLKNISDDEEEEEGKYAHFSSVQSESELETDDENESDVESNITYPSDQSDIEEERKPQIFIRKRNLEKSAPFPMPLKFKILQEDNDFEDE